MDGVLPILFQANWKKLIQCIYGIQYHEKQNLFHKRIVPVVKAEQNQASESRSFSCERLYVHLMEIS